MTKCAEARRSQFDKRIRSFRHASQESRIREQCVTAEFPLRNLLSGKQTAVARIRREWRMVDGWVTSSFIHSESWNAYPVAQYSRKFKSSIARWKRNPFSRAVRSRVTRRIEKSKSNPKHFRAYVFANEPTACINNKWPRVVFVFACIFHGESFRRGALKNKSRRRGGPGCLSIRRRCVISFGVIPRPRTEDDRSLVGRAGRKGMNVIYPRWAVRSRLLR